jgi:glycosyltransferase involved in cell wall biosynthesis
MEPAASKMKILHVLANIAPRYGGPPKACQDMARAVAALGHEVSIYTTNQDGSGILAVPLGQPVYEAGVETRYFAIQPPRFWGTSLPLARALKERIPAVDLVHVHSLYLFHDLATGYYCRRYGVPYVMQPHGALDPYIYRRHRLRKTVMEVLFENRNISKAAAMQFTTTEEEALARPYTGGAPGLVAPLGVHPAEYAALPAAGAFRAAYPEIGERRIILFLGRINFKKGLDLLVRAFARLARERPDLHLVVAGPDDDGWGEQVRSWAREEQVLDRVTFTGMLLGAAKLAVLRDAEIFALPSYSENFGIAVVEALACGLPVVISDKVNIWREIAAARAGVVVPCDTGPLAAALGTLLDDAAARREMADRGRQLAQETFSWDKVAMRLVEGYNKVIAGKIKRFQGDSARRP